MSEDMLAAGNVSNLPLFLDVAQVAALLGMNEATVRRLLKEERIAGDKVGGKWLVCRDVLFPEAKGGLPDISAPEAGGGEDGPEMVLPEPADVPPGALRYLRKEAGFPTMKAFSDASGIAYGTYTVVEKDPSSLSLKLAMKLADFYGCPLDVIVGRPYNDPADREFPVQAFYDSLSSENKGEMESFMRYLEYREAATPSSVPSFMKPDRGEMLG